jgi:hypothetical protein
VGEEGVRAENGRLRALVAALAEQLDFGRARSSQLQAKIDELAETAARLSGQVAELTARLGSDSSKFSKPRSQDGPAAKPRSRSLRARSLSNPAATWIEVHDKRGRAAIDQIGVLPRYGGILARDAWAPCDALSGISAHQLCCAHLPRELQAVADRHAHQQPRFCWAAQTAQALRAIIAEPDALPAGRRLIVSALALAHTDPSTAGKLAAKHSALQRRIAARLDDYLRFATTAGLPATNNAAQQEIRNIKIKQKIAETMRTTKGARRFAAIRSYLSTAGKHHTRALTALASFTTIQRWLPATT